MKNRTLSPPNTIASISALALRVGCPVVKLVKVPAMIIDFSFASKKIVFKRKICKARSFFLTALIIDGERWPDNPKVTDPSKRIKKIKKVFSYNDAWY